LGDGSALGITIDYKVQPKPGGIVQGLILAEDFVDNEAVTLILGDNVFHGSGMGEALRDHSQGTGAAIFAQKVSNPEDYGVVEFDKLGRAMSIEEKPIGSRSSFAIPGLYFYDKTAVPRAKTMLPSARGELEVSDLNKNYLRDGLLNVVQMPRGTVWLDTGTIEGLSQASDFVKAVESRQGLMIACPEETAWRMGLISTAELLALSEGFAGNHYGRYLRELSEPA